MRIFLLPVVVLSACVYMQQEATFESACEIAVREQSGQAIVSGSHIDQSCLAQIPDTVTQLRLYNTQGTSLVGLNGLGQFTSVEVSGECISGCVWAVIFKPNVCFHPGTEFRLHAWHFTRAGLLLGRDVRTTREYVDKLRPRLKLVAQDLPRTSAEVPVPEGLISSEYEDLLC